MKENQQILTGCGMGDIAPYVFLCGDPARVPKISAQWDDFEEVAHVREYLIHTGTKNGIRMTASSTGIGCPSTAICFEEMVNLGAHTLIRIGNSGAVANEIELGDYVISTGAVRDDGTSKSYVQVEYPAVASYEVVSALVAAARESGQKFHAGIVWSADGFYARNKVLGKDGQLAPMAHGGFEQSWSNDMIQDMKRARVKNIEMESATMFTLANLFGVRAGTICTVSDRTPWSEPGQDMMSLDTNIKGAISIAIEAVLKLAAGE
ncbi:MAG: nucleoside phosphorylase [Verrucomicrobia bacterium]|nr:nucleoside phosphorylase [Verrucomicrobiota bacterium]